MNTVLKYYVLTALLWILPLNGSAQNKSPNLKSFTNSFIKNIDYPKPLINQCLATVTMLKIDIGVDGNIKDMQLSDSADSLFNNEFMAKKKNLDQTTLLRYINIKKLKNISLLMPIYFSFKSNLCKVKAANVNQLKHLMMFNGKELLGKLTLLPPIDYDFIFNRDY